MSEHLSQHTPETAAPDIGEIEIAVPESATQAELSDRHTEASVAHESKVAAKETDIAEATAAVDALFAGNKVSNFVGRLGIDPSNAESVAKDGWLRKKIQARRKGPEIGEMSAQQELEVTEASTGIMDTISTVDTELEPQASIVENHTHVTQNQEVSTDSNKPVEHQAPPEQVSEQLDDTLAVIEASIANHAQAKSEKQSSGEYPRDAKAFVDAMERQGVNYEYEVFEPGSEEAEEYSGIFILNHESDTQDKEPTVRLYRGVRDVDSSILKQSPYALKGLEGVSRSSSEKTAAGDKVRKFIDNPNYDNLTDYVKDLQKLSDPFMQKMLAERLRTIENDVLNGRSLESALRFEHVKSYGGSNAGIDISPYIAASDNANMAGGYSSGAMLIIDVPVSQIAGYGEEGEVLIAGELSADNISGVAIRKQGVGVDRSKLPKIHESIAVKVPLQESEAYDSRRSQIDADREGAEATRLIMDMQSIDTVRKDQLVAPHRQLLEALGSNIDSDSLSYSELRKQLFDVYDSKQKRSSIGERYQIPHDGYSDYLALNGVESVNKPVYSRDTATDGMLENMRKGYLRRKEWDEEVAFRIAQKNRPNSNV